MMAQKTSIKVPVFTFDVRLTDRVDIQAGASVPDVTRSAVVSQPTGPFNYSETFSGLGDTSLLGWYRLPIVFGWSAIVNAGASIPTGKTETPRFRSELSNGSLVPMSRLQRGSGTVDPIVGINVSRRVYKGTITTFGSMAARAPRYENKDGLRTGTSSEVNAGVAREAFTHRIVAIGRLGWLHRNQDSFRGTPVLVGGGDWLYATPGAAIQVAKETNVQVDLKIPVYRRLKNMQLDSRAVFQIGVSREF